MLFLHLHTNFRFLRVAGQVVIHCYQNALDLRVALVVEHERIQNIPHSVELALPVMQQCHKVGRAVQSSKTNQSNQHLHISPLCGMIQVTNQLTETLAMNDLSKSLRILVDCYPGTMTELARQAQIDRSSLR